MKVATKIVEYQRGFLEYGEEAMKPLVLHDIAEAVGKLYLYVNIR
jgi:RNA polymerase sigma-54 factor